MTFLEWFWPVHHKKISKIAEAVLSKENIDASPDDIIKDLLKALEGCSNPEEMYKDDTFRSACTRLGLPSSRVDSDIR